MHMFYGHSCTTIIFEKEKTLGVKHNNAFLRHKIPFSVSMGGRTEPHAISSHLKLPKQRYTQRETHSSNSCKTQLI